MPTRQPSATSLIPLIRQENWGRRRGAGAQAEKGKGVVKVWSSHVEPIYCPFYFISLFNNMDYGYNMDMPHTTPYFLIRDLCLKEA